MYALCNSVVLTGYQRLTDTAVIIREGKIESLLPQMALPANMPQIDLNGHILSAGFIDLQLNGCGGVMFNDAPTTETRITSYNVCYTKLLRQKEKSSAARANRSPFINQNHQGERATNLDVTARPNEISGFRYCGFIQPSLGNRDGISRNETISIRKPVYTQKPVTRAGETRAVGNITCLQFTSLQDDIDGEIIRWNLSMPVEFSGSIFVYHF